MSRDQSRHESPDIGDAEIRVERHFENAARQRQPRFLKSPETSHAPAHPNVEAAFFGYRGGQFADHQGRRQTPEQRRDHQNQQRGGVARFLNDVFESVRAAGNHEIRCRNHGHDGNLAERLHAAVLGVTFRSMLIDGPARFTEHPARGMPMSLISSRICENEID